MRFVSKRKLWVGIGVLCGLMAWGRCLVYWDYPYSGRVVDRETGEPIAGAVVVAEYVSLVPSPAGTAHRVITLKEVVTDEEGRFQIPLMIAVNIDLSFLEKFPRLYVQGPGYERIRLRNWVKYEDWKKRVERGPGGEPVIKLRRLKSRKDFWDNVDRRSPFDCTPEKCPRLLELVDKDRVRAGLDP